MRPALAMALRVTVAEIPEEGVWIRERVDPAAWGVGTPDLTFPSPWAVAAFFQRQDEAVLVAVEAEGAMDVVCGRCLAVSRQPYHGAFQLAVEIQRRLSIDVTEEVRQEILLSYPMTWQCQAACRGLCRVCGGNLNEGPCACPGPR